MSFFVHSFGFREPYQVLGIFIRWSLINLVVDGTFCQAALKCKIHIKEQIPSYIGAQVQLCMLIILFNEPYPLADTTRCVFDELEKLGKTLLV